MYQVIVDHRPSETDNNVINNGVFEAHAGLVGERDKSFSVFLKNNVGEIFGGIRASLIFLRKFLN